jgi:acetyl esterase/lipase
MTVEELDPQILESLRRVPPIDLEKPLRRWFMARASALAPGAKVDGIARRVVREGDARVRVYVPERPSGAALLWIHGGGLVIGSARMDDRLCGETARDTGAIVVSADYRLAPRHPFPAAHDDVHAAWSWLRLHAPGLGIDLDRIAVGGQSAGGGLAAALVQRLHDDGVPIAAQLLLCPMLDDRTAADRGLDARRHLVWNNRANLVGWRSYLGREPGADEVPRYAVPARREDLAGLPPTWMYWSEIELFAAEDRAYAERLRAAGVPVTVVTLDDAPHGFEAWGYATPPAQELLAGARSWLAEALG